VATQFLAGLICLGVLMSAPGISAAQTSAVASQVTVQGTVAAVDHARRTVTIRGQQGNLVTVDVPANATRFEAVKVGDAVAATYYDSISVRLKPAGEPAIDQRKRRRSRRRQGRCQVRRGPSRGWRP